CSRRARGGSPPTPGGSSGGHRVEVDGNRASRAGTVGEEIDRMLTGVHVDASGVARQLSAEDFMVVTPYNEQVRCLRQAFPDGVRVGTVDKFQGQEAPVVFFSMATSSGADAPRNLGFLFSRNRLKSNPS